MAVTEFRRRKVLRWFEEHMEPDVAETLMDMLPPVSAADLATKDDVRTLGVELRAEMSELRGEMGELRGEMGELRGEMTGIRGEMSGMAGELRGEMGAMEARLAAQSSHNARMLFFGMLGSNATLVGIVLAATSIG